MQDYEPRDPMFELQWFIRVLANERSQRNDCHQCICSICKKVKDELNGNHYVAKTSNKNNLYKKNT